MEKEFYNPYKKRCFAEDNIGSCLTLERIKTLMSNKNSDYENFYTKIVPEYCYDKKFAPACSIIAIEKGVAEVKYDITQGIIKRDKEEKEYAKRIIPMKEAVKMLDFGCRELGSSNICENLAKMYFDVDDMEKAKEYGKLTKIAKKQNDRSYRLRSITKDYEYISNNNWTYT